jgi:hypothetical protein
MNIIPGLSLGRIGNLPTPIKILAGFLGGGSVLGIAWFIFDGNKTALLIIALGMVLVFLLLAVYKALLGWMRKRRANPLTQGLAGNAAAAPQGISEPARRARLDDLRRNFDQGVEKFRAAGKNLYSVPWYVLVGEPGSGKTEAIRHCNVGFPPGLQDQLQGAGGTLNMNWWFTNQAIILDTAGRLMFEEVAPGTTNEWAEFLKLLKTNRPNSPLNGMLLVIPVDTLIKDSADQIEKKAGKIAQQFDQIQRTLGVRFPVFVIITKCDLLNGFREFFDDLNDPQLQHQIMGWSNPAALDERFDPAAVTTHLDTVKKRLTDRRQQLLMDPVNTEDPQGRRVDQVDALYALPDSLTKIAPRLRRYLEMIFVAGEWSPKPLFLRGIYFTSSMTEGSALDAELAEVLGVPVDSLPEGRVWRRDRAYFLRDLFIEKVFREKGLVTRASNADKQQRTRRAVVLAFGFIAVAVLFAFTWFGAKQLEKSIGHHRDFWVAAATFDPREMEVINQKANNKYSDLEIQMGKDKSNIAGFFGSNLPLVQADIDVPLLFKPMSIFTGSVNGERRNAYRALYEATILRPVYDATRKKIPTLGDAWTPDATAALAQLMKLEYAKARPEIAAAAGPASQPGAHPYAELDPLFRVVLSPADYDKYKANDAANLQTAADWVYTDAAGGAKAWPPAGLAAGSPDALAAIDAGIGATLAYWQRQTSDRGDALAGIAAVRQALKDFRDAENGLIALKNRPIDKLDLYNEFRDSWQAGLTKLLDARTRATTAWAAAAKSKAESATLEALYRDEIERVSADARKACDALLQYTGDPAPNADAAKHSPSFAKLLDARTRLQGFVKQLDSWNTGPAAKDALAEITALDAAFLGTVKGTDSAPHRRFEVQAQLYELADGLIVKKAPAPAAGPLADAFTKVDDEANKAVTQIDRLLIQANGADDRLSLAGDLSKFAIDASARCKRLLFARGVLDDLPEDAAKWQATVAARAAADGPEHLARPAVPLVASAEKTFAAKFSPDTVGAVADNLTTIKRVATESSPRVLDAADLAARVAAKRKGFDAYLVDYVRYWKDDVREELKFDFKNFAEFADALVSVGAKGVSGALDEYGNRMAYALDRAAAAADDVTAVKAAAGLNRNKAFQEEASDVLSAWKNLGGDPRQARTAILGMDPAKFLEGFTAMSAKNNDGFVAYYWQGLPREGLRVLALDGLKEITAGLAELAKYERFPLAPPGDKKDDLTVQDLLAARTALEKVRGASAAAAVPAAAAGTPGARLIGQGGATRDKEIDAILDRLRGTNLLKEKQEYFDKLDKFFSALPTDNKPLSVTLSVNKEKLKDDNSVSYRYAYMLMTQGGKELREAALNSTIADACPLDYPAGDVTLQFREVPKGNILQTETFSGPWGVFRLLKHPNVKSVTREANKWTIEYAVTDANKKTYSLWLVLDFKASVPDLKEWPVPPAKR